MTTNYTLCLPSYSVGPDCYKDIPAAAGRLGKTAVAVGGKTALEKAKEAMLAGVAGSDVTITDFIWYGGNCNTENIARLEADPRVRAADLVFAVGGGRAVDTCKVFADHLGKPVFSFPTIASNCAGCTAISVVYNPDDSLHGYYYPKTPPVHTFIHTGIIAGAPEEFLWAGIGDALSKECEVKLATRGLDLPHTPLMGQALAGCCTKPLVEFGAQALADCRAGVPSRALQEVALDIIISTGLVSNMTTHETEYYYNSSIAHAVYNGSTVVPACVRGHRHGEVVAFGVLVLLTYDGQLEERARLMAFNKSIGLPVTMAGAGLSLADLPALADKASTVTEWTCTPYPMNKEKLIQAIVDCDKAGRAMA